MSSATSRSTPQAPQTTGDTQYNVHDAALRGASSAFSKPPVKPKPKVNTYTGGNNGALLAATKVGIGTPRSDSVTRNSSPLRKDWTGGSARSVNRFNQSPMKALSPSSSSSNLGIPEDPHLDRIPSPSNIAAKLAAARYSPMKPIPQATVNPVMSERDMNEGDVLPPSGSVGNVLARLEPKKPKPGPQKRRGSIGSLSIASTIRASADDRATDDTPIPPTTSLVKIFEKNRPSTPTKAPMEPFVVSPKVQPLVRSPKPQRKIILPPEPKDDEPLTRARTQSPPLLKPKPPRLDRIQSTDDARDPVPFSMLRKDTLGTPPVKQKPSQLSTLKTNTTTLPKPPPKRGSRQARPRSQDLPRSTSFHRSLSASLDSNDIPSSPTSFVSAKEEQEEEEKVKPDLPPPRRSQKPKPEATPLASTPSTPLPFKPRTPIKIISPIPPPEQFSPSRPLSALASSPPSVYHKSYQRESVKEISKHMTGESLSSAIVGAALASSRNASPAPLSTATPPLPTRKQHHHHSPFHHRSPSPQKPTGKLRTTLRKESSSSSEDETEKYKRKGTRIMGMGRKHPNKHHEGTRKRWRDQITERERKRYEGVWAANKGIFIPAFKDASPTRLAADGDPAHDVLNVVTREIWARSRLPEHVLEEVWDLVDGRGVGRLSREEFVVGLWLIDQRLKGRKLPVKVSESVWASVRGVGVKVKVRPHR